MQLTPVVLNNQSVVMQLGDDEIRGMITEVVRLSGSGFTLKMSKQGNVTTILTQLQQAVQQIAAKEQGVEQDVVQLTRAMQAIAQKFGAAVGSAQSTPRQSVAPVSQFSPAPAPERASPDMNQQVQPPIQ